ncbi:MAG: peptide ABC transporter substrate-binding protein [Spirochaetaceae bacterium]|jgi:peptide/nickel transport system substrate-binding protein/oligopeptide transport system substrate-binding protein|nr:peptide ABC transporter substrate-binding protein [Spirochaetaceae bacterium]
MKRLILLSLCSFLFLSCVTEFFFRIKPGKKENGQAPVERYAEARPNIADRNSLTVSFYMNEIELDIRKSFLATEAQVFTALFEGLFTYHPLTMEPMPAAIEKWKLSDDKKTWTFTLKENLRYWNGDALGSEDFREAWLSVIDPSGEAPYSSLFDIIEGARDYRLGKTTEVSGVGIETPDKRTLVVRLTSPAAFFPSMLCHHSFSPIHPSMLKRAKWNSAPIISNGPFYIFEQSANKLVLARNDLYWDAENVKLKQIVIKFSENGEAAAALWNSGEARWISGEVNFEVIKDRSGIEVNPIFATHYYYIRSAHEPWSNHKVRRALALALPWQEIRSGYYLPAKTLIYPISGYPEVSGISAADVKEARRLLTEAGFEGGAGMPMLVLRISPGRESERIGKLMSNAWTDALGIKVKTEVVPFPKYFDSLKQDNYDVGFSTWIGDFADPYTFLQMWRRDSNLNDARYNDSDYEQLLERSMSEDGEERFKTLSKAEKLLLERGTVLPISYSYAVNIIDMAELEGWFRNILDIHPFKYLSYKNPEPLPGVVLLRP